MANEDLKLRIQTEGARRAASETDNVKRSVKELGDTTRRSSRDFDAGGRANDRYRRGLFGLRGEATLTGRGMRVMARGAAYGGAAVAALAGIITGKAIGAASDMAETVSKSDTTFLKQAAGMRRWSQDASTALGMSRQQALDAASGFAGYGKAAGVTGKELAGFSAGLVKSAADMASFHNTSSQEALDAIRSGLAGETEPLRRFNIQLTDAALRDEALRQGLIKTTKEALTPQQKTLAAQRLITRGLGDAQNDFARTSASASNQQKIAEARSKDLQATIGKGLLPMWVRVLGVTNRLIPRVEAFVVGMQDGTGAGGRFAGKMRAVGGVLARAGGIVMTGVRGMQSFVTWLRSGSDGAGLVQAAVIGLTAGIVAFNVVVGARGAVKALKAARLAMIGFNVAMIANPVGLVVAGVVGLGVAVVVAYKKVGWFREIIKDLWHYTRVAFAGMKLVVLRYAEKVTWGMSKIPGPMQKSFKRANSSIRDEIKKTQKTIDNLNTEKARREAKKLREEYRLALLEREGFDADFVGPVLPGRASNPDRAKTPASGGAAKPKPKPKHQRSVKPGSLGSKVSSVAPAAQYMGPEVVEVKIADQVVGRAVLREARWRQARA